jgi:DNA-binding NtrC family response regulator
MAGSESDQRLTSAGDKSESKSLRVLVVDDERLSRHTSASQLRSAGFESRAVENAERALEALRAERWDVVLCDLRMPGMSGIELLRTIRREFPGVAVILMTAYATAATATAAMQDGAADYLTKPFRFEELRERLDKLNG